MRTSELDKHWNGQWYCHTCKFYTGQPAHHDKHELEKIHACNCEFCGGPNDPYIRLMNAQAEIHEILDAERGE